MKTRLKKTMSVFLAILMMLTIIPLTAVESSAIYSTSRDDGVWLFPLDSAYYYFTDWAGCPGYGNCPFCGKVHNEFGDNYHTWQSSGGGHNGIDVGAPKNANVYAPANGIVFGLYNGTDTNDGRGKIVMLKHDLGNGWAYYSYSQHLNDVTVSVGQNVSAGTIIGKVGSSGGDYGVHLHFGIIMAPSSYSYSQVLVVDYGSGNNWLKDVGYATGKIITNPKNGGTNLSSVNDHRGSVTYTFDKNSVKLPNSSVATTGISLNTKEFTIGIGESKTITATVTPSNATDKNVSWSSSDTKVATVSNGKITGVSAGTCTVTAKASGGQTATCRVIIFPKNAGTSAFTNYNGHYYELYDYVTSWYDAKTFCEDLGGHLVTITTEQENEAVWQLAQQGDKIRYHIGGTDEETEGTWKWITGETFDYINLGDGEPNPDICDSEDYLFITSATGKWGDVPNYAGNPSATGFICEYETVPQPDAVTVIDGKVYELWDRQYTITAADDFAKEKGGYLLSLASAEEQAAVGTWLRANTNSKYIALGATDEETEGVWKWTSGEPWGYTAWNTGEPNNTNENEDGAVWILSSDNWNDVPITYSSAFVVEYTLDDWLKQGNSLNDILFDKLPDGANPDDYDIVTEYRSRDKSTTTSTAGSLDGWTKYDSETTYGAWSSVQSTSTKPTASDTLQITGTWTQYHYFHYVNYYDGCYNIDSIPYGTSSGKHTIDRNSALSPVSLADQGGKQAYGSQTCSCGFNYWFLSGTTLFYNYQTRSKTTTNYFYKWSEWTPWTTTPITATDTREVETRTVYRLKDTPALTVTAISVASKPTKTVYTQNEELDTSGLSLKVTYSDGTSKVITSGFTVSAPDMITVGTKTITVNYGGKTATFTVTVNAPANVGALRTQLPTARVGKQVNIPIYLDNAELGTLTFQVQFDGTKLRYVSYSEDVFSMISVGVQGDSQITVAAINDSECIQSGKVLVLTFEVLSTESCNTDLTLNVVEATAPDANDTPVAIIGGTWSLQITKGTLGDINDDDKITAVDARWALQAASGARELDETQAATADVNGDGKISAVDARWILQIASGARVL